MTYRALLFEILQVDIPPLLFNLMEMKLIINFAHKPHQAKKSEGDDKDFEYAKKWKKEGQSYGDTCDEYDQHGSIITSIHMTSFWQPLLQRQDDC